MESKHTGKCRYLFDILNGYHSVSKHRDLACKTVVNLEFLLVVGMRAAGVIGLFIRNKMTKFDAENDRAYLTSNVIVNQREFSKTYKKICYSPTQNFSEYVMLKSETAFSRSYNLFLQ